MSTADNARKRPDFLDNAFTPKPKDPANDPLAELARLIGQADPFAEQPAPRKPAPSLRADDRPAPEWLSRPAPAQDYDDNNYRPAPRDTYGRDDYQQGQYAEEPAAYDPQPAHSRPFPSLFPGAGREPTQDGAGQGAYAQDGRYDDYQSGYQEQEYRPDGRYHVAPPPVGDYDPDSYYADDGHMPPGEEAAPQNSGRRNTILTIAAVVGLAVVGTAGAFGYRAFTGSTGPTNPPVIKADTTPAKIVPAAPAQGTDASGKPFQERIGATGATPERVVSREEQPVSLQVAPPRAAVPVAPPQQQGAPAFVPPAPQTIAPGEPKRVKTMTIRPDGSETTSAFPATTPPSAAAPRAPAPGKQQLQSGSSAPVQLAPPPPDRTKVASRPPTVTPSGGPGTYVVQVSAQRTEAEAQSSYRALQAKYPSVLSGREANIRRVDLGDKGGVFFRAQVGSFGTSEQATTFCNSLKEAGGQCIVQRN
jgi:hypothetical protein